MTNNWDLKKCKKAHDLLVKIRIGKIKYSDKEHFKDERIKKIREDARNEWLKFKAKYFPGGEK